MAGLVGYITIKSADEKTTLEIPADIYGTLQQCAVHLSVNPVSGKLNRPRRWNVTHIPTGLRIARFKLKSEAIKLATALGSNGNYTGTGLLTRIA